MIGCKRRLYVQDPERSVGRRNPNRSYTCKRHAKHFKSSAANRTKIVWPNVVALQILQSEALPWFHQEATEMQSPMLGFPLQLHPQSFFWRVFIRQQQVFRAKPALPSLIYGQRLGNNLKENVITFILCIHIAACDKRYECDHFLFHLRRLVVHRLYSDVKADPSDCFTSMVGYRENKLDLLGVRADVHDRRHVGYFHEVYCMLKTGRNQSFEPDHICACNIYLTKE